jgi:hypothetical protein
VKKIVVSVSPFLAIFHFPTGRGRSQGSGLYGTRWNLGLEEFQGAAPSYLYRYWLIEIDGQRIAVVFSYQQGSNGVLIQNPFLLSAILLFPTQLQPP